MKRKQRSINSFTLGYHPLVDHLLSQEHFLTLNPDTLTHLDEQNMLILLQTITLHVIPKTADHFLLLTPDPLFSLLKQHPSMQNQKVSLCEYQDSERNTEQTITTLMLTLPALHYQYQSSSLPNIASRLNRAKSSHHLFPSTPLLTSLPKKTQLADFAGVSPSAIRLPSKK